MLINLLKFFLFFGFRFGKCILDITNTPAGVKIFTVL